MSSADSKELEKVFTHKPHTSSQKRAMNENFAHRQLRGMQGMLAHLRGVVPDSVITTLTHATARGIDHIKAEQYNRKKARLQAELATINMILDPESRP